MIHRRSSSIPWRRPAFSLIELIVVMGVVVILMGVVVSFFGRAGGTVLKTGAEQLTVGVEQARTSAITRRKPVALVVLEPGQGGFNDGRCRLGLFELEEVPSGGVMSGIQLQRWEVLPEGLAFFGETVDGLENVRAGVPWNLSWRDGQNTAVVYALVFTRQGGLSHPAGSESVVVTVGNGTYVDGNPKRTSQSGSRSVRIGRVVARPWNLDR